MRARLVIAITITCFAWLNSACGTQPASPETITHTPTRCEEDEPCWNCRTMGNHVCVNVPYWDSATGFVRYGALPLPGADVPLDKWGVDQPLADAIASDHAGDVCAMSTTDPVLNRVRTQYLNLTMHGIACS